MKLKSIFSFVNPIDYLEHYYDYHKRHTPGFSFATFSNKAKIQSPNYLKQIISKSRKITIDKFCLISKALGLSQDEQEYFEVLINLNQAISKDEREYFKRRLSKFGHQRTIHKQVKTKKTSIIDQWYTPVLLLSLHLSSNKSKHKDICNAIGINEEELNFAIEQFLKEGFLKTEKGKYIMTEQYVIYDSSRNINTKFKNFLLNSLEMSKKAFINRYDENKFYSHYFKLDKKNYSIYISMFDELVSKMTDQSDKESGHDLFLMNLQFIEPF